MEPEILKELPSCFKAYDIRGRVPGEFNPDMARKIGLCFAKIFQPGKVVIGQDIRLSSPEISRSLASGFLDMGVDVLDLGLCGTEEVYHAVFSREEAGIGGGIMVTASHNPADYNGMKFVGKGAVPVSGESGLMEIARMMANHLPAVSTERGNYFKSDNKDGYINHLLSYINLDDLRPLKLVVNSGNGCAGPVLDLLAKYLPFDLIRVFHEPDGNFPHGVPNPLLPEKREMTGRLVREHGADMGLAWDGDFDRCFFWDERGSFIEGYYIVGLLAQELLRKNPGSKILHDPRLIWNTQDLVESAGGIPVVTKTGHAFIKERMRLEDALYGGEMSAHHYFRDFSYCDSGMIPFLLVSSLLSRVSQPLSVLVSEMIENYPVSGEINSKVKNPDEVIAKIEKECSQGQKEFIDGLSITFPTFRFNIRKSNTEPLLRLNVESRGDKELLERKTEELLAMIKA